MEEVMDNEEVVIVGAGISGLATALALHRKGIKSIVMERSLNLRNTTGAAIGIRPNGWRALSQLGVAHLLRRTAFPINSERDVWLDGGKQEEKAMGGETRCLKRRDLIDTLYAALPPGTVEFGCQLESIKLHPYTTFPILRFVDGSSIMAKVVIGCDGANSIVGNFLDLKPTKIFPLCGVRALTNYPNGHSFAHEFARYRSKENVVGIIPIDDNLVYWFSARRHEPTDERVWEDPELIRKSTLESLNGFYPKKIQEMVERADAESLSLARLRYRAPWDLLMGSFRKGTVTVAGDAMHVMGPFLGQGGSAGLEDAVVLARNLAQSLTFNPVKGDRKVVVQKVGEALDGYIKERRMRVVRLSMQTYLTGLIFTSLSPIKRLIFIALMVVLFRNPSNHIDYDCGVL